MKKISPKSMSTARRTALVGIMAASIECGKLVLAAIPNVEVVTLLVALYSYVFGWLGIVAAAVFVALEPLIWGVGTWMISYFIHWPAVALIFCLLGAARVKNRLLLSGISVLLTAAFGILTSLVDVGLFTGSFNNFGYRFSLMYMRGIPFYVTQIACNAVLFLFVFQFLARKLFAAKRDFF